MTPDQDRSIVTAALEAVAADVVREAPIPLPSRRRYEIAEWDLSELLADPSEAVLAAELKRLEGALVRFEARRDDLDPAMDRRLFLEVVREFEQLQVQISSLAGYSSLWFAADTQHAPAVSFRDRIRQVLAQVENRYLFFEIWWQSLADDEVARLLPPADGSQQERDFHHYLSELRRFKPHTLDESSEQLINTKNANGIEAVLTIYSMLTNRLEFSLEIDGQRKTLTEGEMRSLFYSPDPDLRAAVYRELFGVYERDAKALAQIYASRVRDWYDEQVTLRGFASPIAVRNLRNGIPDEAVDTLLAVVHRNAPLFQEYFKLKGEWLGIEPLRRYDLYAPLATSSQFISYGDAIASVLDTFRSFDEHFAALAERVIAERHIDAAIRKGKRSGAFCSTVLPQLTPWVMVNYTGRMRDVATLAHELGHAVHSMLASHHSTLTQNPSLPLAETASVFSEMLMTDRLLSQQRDPMVRRELLAAAVDDVYATVMRQTYFVRFEIAAHEAILANKTADDLFALYLENLREQFGDSLVVTPEFRYEWVSIPHIFRTPFYCYAYSFGQLLVLALYRRYQEEGDAFKPGYLRLLSYGGAARPEEILSELGIDIADPDFWQGGFDLVRGMIDELKSIEIA